MGTSTGYDMPRGGDWTPLKHEATKFVKDDGTPGGNPNPVQPRRYFLTSLELASPAEETPDSGRAAGPEAEGRRPGMGVEAAVEEEVAAGEVSGALRAAPEGRSAASSQESRPSAWMKLCARQGWRTSSAARRLKSRPGCSTL